MHVSRSCKARAGCRIGSIALLLAAAFPVCSTAQGFPNRPIRFVVGFVPGGVADLLARSLGQKLTEAWGQQVIIDNRAGAGGAISMQIAARAAPDGYTLLMGSSTQFSISPALGAKLSYDPIRDYTPISQAALTPVILTVLVSSPARSLPELIEIAKSRRGEAMNFGSSGYGGAPHIAGELLKRVAGIALTHVPYKGGGESIIAGLGGHVPMTFGAVSTALPHLRAGRLRALGVTSLKRLSAIPEVPTFAEAGLPGFEVGQWYGVFAPAGLPHALVRRMNEALVRIIAAAELKDHFSAQGVELESAAPEKFAAYVSAELVRWTRALREMGIRAE